MSDAMVHIINLPSGPLFIPTDGHHSYEILLSGLLRKQTVSRYNPVEWTQSTGGHQEVKRVGVYTLLFSTQICFPSLISQWSPCEVGGAEF